MWNRIRTLIIKEFLAVWRDVKSRTVLIVPPLTQLFIFAFAATLEVRNVPIGILNRDNGKQGFELVQRFNGSPMFSRIVHLEAEEQITPFIDNMHGAMVISLEQTFSGSLEKNENTSVQIILDGRRSNTAQILAGYAATIVQRFYEDFSAKRGIQQQNTNLVIRNWFNPNLHFYWYNIPCLSGILTMVVVLLVTALSVARERELGTFEQLLVSPATPFEILIGKILPAMLIGVVEGSAIIAVGVFVFDIPFTGSLLFFYLNLFVFILSIVGVGIFISSLCRTQQQAVLGTFTFISPSVLLSGFSSPIENMPIWLQKFTNLIPLKFYIMNAKGVVLKDVPLTIILSNIWPMALIAVFTLTVSSWIFGRRLQ